MPQITMPFWSTRWKTNPFVRIIKPQHIEKIKVVDGIIPVTREQWAQYHEVVSPGCGTGYAPMIAMFYKGIPVRAEETWEDSRVIPDPVIKKRKRRKKK